MKINADYIPIKAEKLPVMEHYYTIQGEGNNSGKAAYFIRIGGCSVGCHWCDVKESWDAKKHLSYTIDQIISWVKNSNAKFVVITGGEPTEYDLTSLTEAFLKLNVQLFLETSGAFPITGIWHWICLSPKKRMPVLEKNFSLANELKVIIYNKDDFKFAEQNSKKVNSACKLFLQPEWDKKTEMMPYILDYIKQNPKWTLSLQTHKYINIP